MQVILMEKVANLGDLGAVVRVKDGYARNFLIPQRMATAKAQGDKLSGMTVQITQKSGVDGRLFGSVTNHDIADALGKQGFTVDKSQIRMPTGPLKTTGEHALAVALHTDVIAEVKINVVGDHS